MRVDLLLPAKSNHRMSDIARDRALRSLAQAGAQVWLAPQMLHAKLAVIDDRLALAGSANFDSRSLFLNYELMIAFHVAEDVQRFAAWYEHERTSATTYAARAPGLLRDRYDSAAHLAGFTAPVLVVVAGRDTIVAPQFGKALYDGLDGPKRLLILPGSGHNDWVERIDRRGWTEAVEFLLPTPR